MSSLTGISSFTPHLSVAIDSAMWVHAQGENGTSYTLDSSHPQLMAGGAYEGVLHAEVLDLTSIAGGVEDKTVVNLAVNTGEEHQVFTLHVAANGSGAELPLNPDLTEHETAKVLRLASELAHHLPDVTARAKIVSGLGRKLAQVKAHTPRTVWQRV